MTSTFGDSLEDIQVIPEDGECVLSTICQKTSISPAEVLLLEAARENNVPQISVLVKQRNVGINVTDNMGRSAIAWASMKGNLEALERLINLGADINRCDKYGMTPLLWAAWSGHTKIMIRLVKEDPECARQTNKQGMTILHCAASNDQSHVIEFIGDCLVGFQFQGKDQRGMTALHITCLKGLDESTEVLLKFSSAHVNNLDDHGCTALHYASKNGHVRCLEKLMYNEADMDIQDNLGQTPLHYAAHNNHENVIRILITNLTTDAMNRVTHRQQSALMLAAGRGSVKVVELLLRILHVQVDTQDEHGNTACHLCSRKIPGNVEVMKLLLLSGRCNVNLKNQAHQIPLHVAIEDSQAEIVVLLIRAGSEIHTRNKAGRTPLDLAVRSDEVSIVDFIIQAERIINLSNDSSYFKNKHDATLRQIGETLNFYEEIIDQTTQNVRNRLQNVSRRLEFGDDDDVDDCYYEGMNSFDLDLGQMTNPLETIEEESESRIENLQNLSGNSLEEFKESTLSLEKCDEDAFIKKVFWKVAHKNMEHDDWRKLAKHWKFEIRHIQAIQHQYSSSHKHRKHSYRLLMIWFQCFQELQPSENPTKELFEAFNAIGKKHLAGRNNQLILIVNCFNISKLIYLFNYFVIYVHLLSNFTENILDKIRRELNNDSKKKCILS